MHSSLVNTGMECFQIHGSIARCECGEINTPSSSPRPLRTMRLQGRPVRQLQGFRNCRVRREVTVLYLGTAKESTWFALCELAIELLLKNDIDASLFDGLIRDGGPSESGLRPAAVKQASDRPLAAGIESLAIDLPKPWTSRSDHHLGETASGGRP